MEETKSHYHGLGTIQRQYEQITQVFYSFDLEDPVRNPFRVLGVLISREILTDTEEVLLLRSEEGYILKLLSLKAVLGQDAGFYGFTAEFVAPLLQLF